MLRGVDRLGGRIAIATVAAIAFALALYWLLGF